MNDYRKPQREKAVTLLHSPAHRSLHSPRVSSNRFLEFLSGPKGNLFAGLDLDTLPTGRVPAHARRPLSDLEDAQPADANSLTLLEVLKPGPPDR